MEKGLDVTKGGAVYNSSGMQFVQVANLIDSLQALKELVFSGKIKGSVFLDQLRRNWPDETPISSLPWDRFGHSRRMPKCLRQPGAPLPFCHHSPPLHFPP